LPGCEHHRADRRVVTLEQDRWLGADKFQHFAACAAATVGVYAAVLSSARLAPHRVAIAGLASAALGLCKELGDGRVSVAARVVFMHEG